MTTVLPYSTEITLIVSAPTLLGDTVAVVGSTPELGMISMIYANQ